MKIFLKINILGDCHKLQVELYNFVAWAATLNIKMNIKKCRSMTFSRSQSIIKFSYYINGLNLLPVESSICDPCFTFTLSLCPNAQINNATCNAFKVLGKRLSSEFTLSNSLTHIYCTLVRLNVEYG